MSTVAEFMSTKVQSIEPQQTLQRAAQMMHDLDVGSLPVCAGTRLLGMVTDRDIAVRGVAAGLKPAEACVSDVMTADPEFVTDDQDADEVLRTMGAAQVRRLPVVNVERQLVGIVSLSDLARCRHGAVDETMREICEPGGSHSQ